MSFSAHKQDRYQLPNHIPVVGCMRTGQFINKLFLSKKKSCPRVPWYMSFLEATTNAIRYVLHVARCPYRRYANLTCSFQSLNWLLGGIAKNSTTATMGPLNPWSRRNSVLYGVRMKLSVLLLICLQGISYGIPILGDNLQFDILQRFPQLQRYHANIQKPTDDFDGLLHDPHRPKI